jgi:translation initiation factor RLI1
LSRHLYRHCGLCANRCRLAIEVIDKPKYLRSSLIHGVRELPVQIH